MKNKKLPKFKSEADEREFWSKQDSTEFVDWSKGERARFPNLRPTVRTISLRLPQGMIEDLKILASKQDVPYQSLLKMFLSERIKKEMNRKAKAARPREKSTHP
jgi:predicted DNA binding CopG/RHH family protein